MEEGQAWGGVERGGRTQAHVKTFAAFAERPGSPVALSSFFGFALVFELSSSPIVPIAAPVSCLCRCATLPSCGMSSVVSDVSPAVERGRFPVVTEPVSWFWLGGQESAKEGAGEDAGEELRGDREEESDREGRNNNGAEGDGKR